MKLLTAARVLSLIGALLMATGIAGAQQEDRAATSIPAGAIAYVSADVLQLRAFWDQVKGSSLGKLLAKEFAEGTKKQGDLPIGQVLDMLGQAFAGPVSVAVMDEKPAPGQVPALVAVMPTKGLQEAQAIMTLMQMRLQAEKKVTLATREYKGTTITTISGEKLKGIQPSFALLADRLLVATQPAWLEKALDTTAAPAQGLASDPKFERVRALLAAKGPAPAWFWVDTARLNAITLAMAQDAAAKPPADGQPAPEGQAALKARPFPLKLDAFKPFMEAYTGAGGRLELSPQGIAIDSVTLVNPDNEIGKKILAQKGGPLRSAQLTSGNAIFYFGFNNLPLVMDTVRMMAGAVEGDTQQLLAGIGQTIQSATGLDPKTDILDNLGAEFALALNDLPPDLKSVPALIYVQAKSVPGLGKTMQKLRLRAGEAMGIKFIEKPLPQGRIYHMAADSMPIPIAPGWAFAGDFLVIGATPDALKSPLFLSKGTGVSLAATPAYQKAVGASGDRLLGAAFINLAKVAALAEKLPTPKKKDGKPAVDPEAGKAALKALRTLSIVSGMEGEAMAVRLDLGLDLTN